MDNLNTQSSFLQSINTTDINIKAKFISKFQNIQGDSKIQKLTYLRLSYLKLIITGPILIICSGFILGILAVHFINVRNWLFFIQQKQQFSTHVLIQGNDGTKEIQQVLCQGITQRRHFYYRKLLYFIQGNAYNYLNDGFLSTKNRHQITFPQVYQFLFNVLTTPLFIFQDIICIIYLIQGVGLFAGVMWGFSVGTTLLNYIFMYIGHLKIKQMSQKSYNVSTTNGQKNNQQLNPGDIWIPRVGDIVPCDCLVTQGILYADQSNLTGQTIPIFKQKINKFQKYDQSFWLYQGSKILQSRQASASVIFTGFQSRKGRILRKLLAKNQKIPRFFFQAVFFQLLVILFGLIIYLINLSTVIRNQLPTLLIIFRFFQTLSWMAPPAMPIYFNLCFTSTLLRLRFYNILGTNPQKTLLGGKLGTICFDKTGTLTVNRVIYNSYFVIRDKQFKQLTKIDQLHLDQQIIRLSFASCNDCMFDGKETKGDQIQVQMLNFSKFQSTLQDKKNCFCNQHNKLLVHKVYKFQSDLKRMSVIVQNLKTNKFYIFCKGAPQFIYKLSTNKINDFNLALQKISMQGYRCIAYSYKEITKDQATQFIYNGNRPQVQKNLITIALATFANKLKDQTRPTIQTLIRGDIDVKIITGDNQYIGAQVALRAGIIQSRRIHIIQQINYQKQNPFVIRQIDFGCKSSSEKPQLVCQCGLLYKLKKQDIKKIKVFARATPVDKAFIVNSLIQLQNEKIKNFMQSLSTQRLTVGMVGDGANDVMAIKIADVGMGLTGCQSSSGAGFSLQQINNVVNVVAQGKATICDAVDIFRVYGVCQFMRFNSSMILQSYNSYLNASQLIWSNYPSIIISLILMAFTGGRQDILPYRNKDVFFTLRNFMSYFGHLLIMTGGLIGVTMLTKSWFPTQYQLGAGYNQNNPLVKSHVLFLSTCYGWLPLLMSMGYPFKNQFYRNYIFLAWQITVLVMNISLFYLQNDSIIYIFTFGTSSKLPLEFSAKVLGITQGAICISGLFQFINYLMIPITSF